MIVISRPPKLFFNAPNVYGILVRKFQGFKEQLQVLPAENQLGVQCDSQELRIGHVPPLTPLSRLMRVAAKEQGNPLKELIEGGDAL